MVTYITLHFISPWIQSIILHYRHLYILLYIIYYLMYYISNQTRSFPSFVVLIPNRQRKWFFLSWNGCNTLKWVYNILIGYRVECFVMFVWKHEHVLVITTGWSIHVSIEWSVLCIYLKMSMFNVTTDLILSISIYLFSDLFNGVKTYPSSSFWYIVERYNSKKVVDVLFFYMAKSKD